MPKQPSPASGSASPTPQLDALIASEPDLVDRIFTYLLAEFPHLAGHERLGAAKRAVRQEFGGARAYIPTRTPTEQQQLASQVLALFNGRNAREVARRLGISRASVYRFIKQGGEAKKVSGLSVFETGKPLRSQPRPPKPAAAQAAIHPS